MVQEVRFRETYLLHPVEKAGSYFRKKSLIFGWFEGFDKPSLTLLPISELTHYIWTVKERKRKTLCNTVTKIQCLKNFPKLYLP